MNKALLILSILTSVNAAAGTTYNLEAKFGGWSRHFYDNDNKKIIRKFIDPSFEYNENHKGWGVKAYIKNNEADWNWFAEYWQMNESYNKDMKALSIGLQKGWDFRNLSVTFTMPITFQKRGFLHCYRNKKNEVTSAKFREINLLIPTPYLSIYKGQFHIDATIIPNLWDDNGNSMTFFTRLGYRF